MPAAEWDGWLAYAQHSPIGPERFDYLAAMIISTLINLWSKRKVQPSDCLPPWIRRPPKPPATWQEIKSGFGMFVKRKRPPKPERRRKTPKVQRNPRK